jgi:hypothetical protein
MLAAVLAMATSARAHEDPAGCFETGPAIIVSVFRSDGVTGVVGNVSECETIRYRATLQKASDLDSICAFSGGTFRLTTPDGVVHDIDLNVPCIGGNTGLEGCFDAVNSEVSPQIPYTVSPADVVAGLITATAKYTGGVAHDSAANTAGVAATTPKSTPVVFCADNNLCTTDVCNPALSGTNACSNTPVVCDDQNACTNDACNPATGLCVFTPGPPCDDNNICTTDVCNPATGQCVFTPTLQCDDNNICTVDTCDPILGCQHSLPPDCDDNNPCTDDSCNPTLGCQNVPNNNPLCAVVHFQCYEVKPFSFDRRTVNVEDRFANGSVSIRTPDRLCAPSDKRGENPAAALSPEHLEGFPSVGSSTRVNNQTVANQFGTVKLDVIRRKFLLVPTSKSLTPPPPAPLQNPVTDHFECYLVRRSAGQPRFQSIPGVSAEDQFGTHALDVLRPKYLCVPANKANEDPGALSHTQNLLCYKARHRVRFPTLAAFVNNQFGPEDTTLIRRMEFCVPSTIVAD